MTWRCWTDDFRQARGALPRAEILASAHVVLREFLTSRGQVPEGTEGPVRALGSPFKKIKAGRERGVTLYEPNPQGKAFHDPDLRFPGVVWLLAYGVRKEGDPDDAYRDFERLGADAMRPTTSDYALLWEDLRLEAEMALRRELEDGLRDLRELARRQPEVLHRLALEELQPGVAFVLFDDGETRLLVLPVVDANRRPVSEEVQALMVSIVFEESKLDELEAPSPEILQRIAKYELRPFEFALCRRIARR